MTKCIHPLDSLLADVDAGEVATVRLEPVDIQIALVHLKTIDKDWAVTVFAALAAALTKQLETVLREER